MTTFDSAFARIKNAASSAGLDAAVARQDPLKRIADAYSQSEPGATPGSGSQQDLQQIAQKAYEDQLVLPQLPTAATLLTFGLQPREVERGLRQQMTQAAQALATPGIRAQVLQAILDPYYSITNPAMLPFVPSLAEQASMALEPSDSGLTTKDIQSEIIAMRGAQAGLAAGQQEGVVGDVSRAVGQTLPQIAGVAATVATGGGAAPVMAANIAGNVILPLSSYTAGQLAYMDEVDAVRASEALEGKELTSFSLDEMRKRASISAAIQTGTEIVGGGVAGRAVGTIGAKMVGSRIGRSAMSTLAKRGAPIVERALATKAGQAGAQAFARATEGTMRFSNGFLGNASKIVAVSAAEEGAEELGAALLEAPFTAAPLSKDLSDGLYSAMIGGIAGGAGGGVAVAGAAAGRAMQNRRDAFRPENDAEIALRQAHSEAMKARTDWTQDLDDAQKSEVLVALNSLNGMDQTERGIFLRELADRRADIASKVETLLAHRQDLDAALAPALEAQRTYDAGAKNRAAQQALVSEAQSSLDRAQADYQAARDALAEMQLAQEQQGVPRVARPGRKVVTAEQRQQAVKDAEALVQEASAALKKAQADADAAVGLEVGPGQSIDPTEAVDEIRRQVADTDAELKMLATDHMMASATYAAVREKVSDMPMQIRQSQPSDVLGQLSTASGVRLSEANAPKRGGRVQREMEALGIKVVWFRPSGGQFRNPAFHTMETRGTIYLNADANMSTVRAKAYHEVFHDIQMFRPEIAKAYADRIGIAPVYEAGAQYAQGKAESAAKGRADAFARIQAAVAAAGIEGVDVQVPATVSRIGAARLEQEGQAEAFGPTAARVGGRGVLSPFVRFAARRGLMGREVAGAMSVIDAVARAAAVEKAAGVKPDATLSPLARTLLWMEDMSVDIPAEIEQASQPEAEQAQPSAEQAPQAQPSGVSMSRASDDDYLAAVKRGDMAMAQRMVDAAARAAGYTIGLVYHGTNAKPFSVFDLKEGGYKTGAESARLGFFATDNQKVAQSYADNIGMGGLFSLALGEGPESDTRNKALATPEGKELVVDVNAKDEEYQRAISNKRKAVRQQVAESDKIAALRGTQFEKELDSFIDALTANELRNENWMEDPSIVAAGEALDRSRQQLNQFVLNKIIDAMPNRRVMRMYAKIDNPAEYDAEGKTPANFALTPKIQKAIDDGNDGVIFRNLVDPVEPSTHYVVFESSQFKSADPVTYDEQGNIIPLSKRFDVTTPLISFAREGDSEAASLREQIAVLQRQIRDVQNVTAAQRTNAIREVRLLERRLLTAERVAEQKTLQATRAKMRVELEREAAKEDMATADAQIAKLQTRLDAAKASVQSLKQEVSSLRRGENVEQRLADAEETAQRAIDFAYAIGRREGLVAGQVEGQRQERRVVRKLSERLATVEERLDKAVPALREARTQIKQDAAAAQRAIDFAYGMGLAKGRVQGVMEGRRQVLRKMVQREDTLQRQLFGLREVARMRADQKEQVADAVRRIASDAARMLPEKLRGPLAVRIANAKTLAQANRIAVEAVKVAANAEVADSLDSVKAIRKKLSKRGMTYGARTRVEALLSQAQDVLTAPSGRRLRAAVQAQKGAAPSLVNAVEVYAAVVDAAALVVQAEMLYQMDRQQYLAQRAARIARYDALRQDMLNNMSGRPTLAEADRADKAATIPFYRRVGRANSDIYTMMLELEGSDAGVLNNLLVSAQAGKGEASLEHASILRQIVPALQAAGYTSIDDYALKNGLLGEASANLRTVRMGGQDVTLPVGTILSVAAMDDETLALFPDTPGTAGQGITFAGAETTKTFYPSRQDIEAIRSGLSAEERGIVDAMKTVLETQIRDRVMDAVFAVEGDQPPVVQNYWPRVRLSKQKGDASNLNATAGNLVRGALTNVGFAQARTGGTEPLVYRDAFQTWERHVQVALDMIHMAQPYRDAATVLTDPAVVAGIDRQFGDGTAEMVLAVFSNGVGATARSNPTIIDKLTNNVTGAVLALRPRTLAKVLVGGQMRLASEIPFGYWSKGVARAASRLRNPLAWDARVEEIHSLNGYFSRRHQMHMRSIISGSLSDADRVRISTAWNSMIDSFRAAGQNLAAAQLTDAAGRFKDASNGANMMIASVVDMLRYMDEQIMLAAVEARLAEIEDEGILTGQDALREAALRAERDFRRTQNASDEFDDSLLSAYNRVKGASGWRIFFPFSSDPVKARNQIRRAFISGDRRLETGLAIGANMAASTIIGAASLATTGYLVSLVAGLFGGDGPSDEEEKEAMEAAKRLPVGIANEVMSSTLGYLGIVLGWVTSAIEFRRAPFTPIAVRPVEQVIREATGPKPIPERVVAALLAASQFAGFPMYGLYQFVRDFMPKPEREKSSTTKEPQSPRDRLMERIERRRREIERARQGGAAVR